MNTAAQPLAVRKRLLQWEKLLIAYRRDRDPDSLEALARFLSVQSDLYDPLQDLLDHLSIKLIPQVAPGADGSAEEHQALESLLQLNVIFWALSVTHTSPSLKTYTGRACSMLLQDWDSVAAWMIHLLENGPVNSPTGGDIGMVCTLVLRALTSVCTQDAVNLTMEQVLSHESTVRVLFLLLHRRNRQTGNFWDVAPRQDEEPGAFTATLCLYCHSDMRLHAVVTHLFCVQKEERRLFVNALVDRARQLVDHAKDEDLFLTSVSVSVILQVYYRLALDTTIYRIFNKRNALVEFSQTLFLLSFKTLDVRSIALKAKEFWINISCAAYSLVELATANPYPPRVLAKLIEAGIITISQFCLPFAVEAHPLGADILRAILPYLHSHKVYRAARDHSNLSRGLQEASKLSDDGLEILLACRSSFSHGQAVFDLRRHLVTKMCNSLLCPHPSEKVHMRVCQRCHTMAYCSRECQEEDWIALHSRECSVLASSYAASSKNRTRCSFATKEAYSRVLDHLANWALPSLTSMGSPGSNVETQQQNPSVWVMDDTHQRSLKFQCGQKSLYDTDIWSHRGVLEDRLRVMIHDLEANPDVVLVEALFRFDSEHLLSAFGVIKFSHDAPEREHYTIANYAFSVFPSG